MCESPASLQDICIDYVANNIETLCQCVQYCDGVTGLTSKLVFKELDARLQTIISERLLTFLCDKGKLTDLNITLFDSKCTRLRNVRLANANLLTRKGLRVLKGHHITALQATGLRVTVNDLILCLGDWTLQNLRSLNVARCSFLELDNTKYCVVVVLSKLQSLRYLNLSCTEFSSHGLGIVCEDLPQLEALDISNTIVDDISPLRKCKSRLKSLALCNLKISNESLIPVLLDLTQLRVLDLSDDREIHPFDIFSPAKVSGGQLLRSLASLPNLVSLDMSGKGEINVEDVSLYLDARPNTKFLGLFYSDACSTSRFYDPHDINFNPDLKVTGTACGAQIIESLRRYTHRPLYVQETLSHLFRLTFGYMNGPSVEIIRLVLKGMALHPLHLAVQTGATACLYNLTKGELAMKIHPSLLREVVELTLTAMENFPKHYQMQKNTLLTLCSDRILQDVQFDKYRCARLALICLCNFEDSSISRMSVAICSILAAKICTNETHLLGAQPVFMRKLLNIVRSKVQARSVDVTIKFTLSALWNLTDESPVTCKVFLEEGGMDLFLSVLKEFAKECAVVIKVLGLLNNIAEVPELRPQLMTDKLLLILSKLLDSDKIDVSYFAAGIIAHLASDGAKAWTVQEVRRPFVLKKLAAAVKTWRTPNHEMVSYRSFQPFLPLLARHDTYQVQLWAAWAIFHVCSKSPSKYYPMLVEEEGHRIIKELSTKKNVDANVRSICISILEQKK